MTPEKGLSKHSNRRRSTVNLGVYGIWIVKVFTSGVKMGRNLIGCVVQVVETLALKYILAPFLQLFAPLKSTATTERTRQEC